MKAPGLLFLALYKKVPSLEGADVVTDIKIDCAAQGSKNRMDKKEMNSPEAFWRLGL
jgi:hypothetical protein